jgi:flagellar hook-length control protein FliK
MTMMMNTVTQSTAASAAAATGAAAATPVQNADAQAAQPVQAPGVRPGPAQPFAAWLGDQAQAAALAIQASLPADAAADATVDATVNDAAAPAPEAASAAPDGAGEDDSAAAPPQDGALLAAMAMPLMPLSPAQVAQAVQAAQPSRAQSGPDETGTAADTAAAGMPAIGSTDRAGSPDRGADNGRRAAAPERDISLPQAPAMQAATPAPPVQTQADAVPAVRFGAHAQADTGSGAGADSGSEQRSAAGAAPAGSPDRAALAGAAATQTAAPAPAPDTVKLAGPPTAWRQSLQEALGERLNVQVGKNMEQAVIRLEPPQLGRIDIAIRHSAGTLEVNISATNGEVLRQLQTVSDHLRSDLSQRQFTEVAVTVAPAQKNGAAPFGDPQQGRRQQGREQEDKQPGRALAEASNNPSAFSLGGRE